ncbi:hypothetical protein U1Q18_035970 [Sarracenia purpurea var. burkii]
MRCTLDKVPQADVVVSVGKGEGFCCSEAVRNSNPEMLSGLVDVLLPGAGSAALTSSSNGEKPDPGQRL